MSKLMAGMKDRLSVERIIVRAAILELQDHPRTRQCQADIAHNRTILNRIEEKLAYLE